jgi:hypothetical protein
MEQEVTAQLRQATFNSDLDRSHLPSGAKARSNVPTGR